MSGTGGKRKTSASIRLPMETWMQLKLLHERTQVPTAVRLREAVALLLAKHAAHLSPPAGDGGDRG